MLSATCSAPTNIAVIKYWGKANVDLNTPLNSSLSMTLDQSELRTITTISTSSDFTAHRLWLNGKEELDVKNNHRVMKVIQEMIRCADSSHVNWNQSYFHIASINTFPTAAGLASSASGYACLVATLAELMNATEAFPGHFTTIARQGSGSACRSLAGGLVKWDKGQKDDVSGHSSLGLQIYPPAHWPALRLLVLVVNDQVKETSSTKGMIESARSSAFLQYRVDNGKIQAWTSYNHVTASYHSHLVVEDRLDEMIRAIGRRDFPTFGKLMMIDSNQFHATCLDSYPPIFYLNATSQAIIKLVHVYNAHHDVIRAAYTFDAGPNAVVVVENEQVEVELSAIFARYFMQLESSDRISPALEDYLSTNLGPPSSSLGSIQRMYHTRVGTGVQTLAQEQALLDPESGLPV